MDTTNQSAPLLRTKLRRPPVRPELIARPRLQQQVARGLHLALTLIIAPAGFGKTTLAASSLLQNQNKSAWISLDKNDNQPGYFLRYLIAALQTLDASIGAEAEQYLESVLQMLPEAVLASLINDIEKNGQDIVLVLDDYQLITSQYVHDGVAFLLEHQPQNLHLVIAARSDPPLPLARLRASGQLVELRAADLRFTRTEALEFLNDVMGLHLDEKSAEILEERTEGWIAGLQMAALSLRDRKDVLLFIEGFSGTNRYILDYLLEEVMSGQPNEVQQFLLCTSVLDRLCAPLSDALLSLVQSQGPIQNRHFDNSVNILQYLEKKNLFLISLDEERLWFRYHHLFIDLLRSRLQQSQPDLIPQLHVQAAEWLQQNGLIPEAIGHCFNAADFDRAAELIE
jgi:LuxR family maltose regulon positive regulatory protein